MNADTFALRASLSVQAARKKQGSAVSTAPETAAAFWKRLEAMAAEDHRRITSAREIRASGNSLAAQNDEPEPARRLTAVKGA
jgi:hypothetical protein